jgi:hypothetical protein
MEDLSKAMDIAALDILEKGQKGGGAPIGTIKKMGDRFYIKIATGWKYHSKDGVAGGAKAQEHAVSAGHASFKVAEGHTIINDKGVAGKVSKVDETHVHVTHKSKEGKLSTSKIEHEKLQAGIDAGKFEHHIPAEEAKQKAGQTAVVAGGNGASQKSVFQSFKEKKSIEEHGVNMADPEVKALYDDAKELTVKDLEEIQDNSSLNDREKQVVEQLIKEKTYTKPVERIENYEHALRQIIEAPRGNLFIYGKGGVGKTYNAKKVLEEEYGKNREYNPKTMQYSCAAPDGKADYDYVFPDKVTLAALYELLYAHNGKTIVFDDADGILKDPDAVNLLKKAMDTSKSYVGKDTKGGKQLTIRDKASGEELEVPSSFEFTGKIIFISNKPKSFFTQDEDRRALLSRGKSQELQFTNTETKDLIKDKILQGIKDNADWKTLGDSIPKTKDGKVDKNSNEYKQFVKDVDHVFSYIEDNINEIPESKLNGRTMENLYQSYKYAQKNNEDKNKKKMDPHAYLMNQLLKSQEDELGKSFNYVGGLMQKSAEFIMQMYKSEEKPKHSLDKLRSLIADAKKKSKGKKGEDVADADDQSGVVIK